MVAVIGSLGRKLVSQGIASEEAVLVATETASAAGESLVTTLTRAEPEIAVQVAQFIASDFGLPAFDLAALGSESIPTEFAREDLVSSVNAMPIAKRGNRLFVAISDPANSDALDKYKFATGLSIEAVVVEEAKLAELRKAAADGGSNLTEGLDDSFDLEVDAGAEGIDGDEDTSGVDETPVVRFVNKVLLDAIKRGASDIHVEPYEKIFRIRFRVDGILEEVVHPPLAMAGRLTARLKVMSRMDISERRVPQDGRIKLKLSKTKAIDFRVNTCPTLVRREDGAPDPGPVQRAARHRRARLRAGAEAALHGRPVEPVRHDPGHRPDRLGQDRLALHRPEHPKRAWHEHLDGGGPRRDQPCWH